MRCVANVHLLLSLSGTERYVDISWQARTERNAIGIVSRFGAGGVITGRSSSRVPNPFGDSDSSDSEEDGRDAEILREVGAVAAVDVGSSSGKLQKRARSTVPDESSRPVRRNRKTA